MQSVEQLVEGLPLEVEAIVAPAVIHGAGRFPRHLGGVCRVGELVVAHRDEIRAGRIIGGDAAVDHACRSFVPDQLDQLVAARGRDLASWSSAPGIEPKHVGLVTLYQLGHLRQALALPVFGEVGVRGLGDRRVAGPFRPRRARAAGVFPILPVRVVKPELDAVFPAGLGQFAERVASVRAERRGGDVVVGNRRVPERETVVVFRGDDEIPHARLGREFDPFVGVELHRVELLEQCVVLLLGDAAGLRPSPLRADPLGVSVAPGFLALPDARRDRIQPEMDEHAEAGAGHPVRVAGSHLRVVALPGHKWIFGRSVPTRANKGRRKPPTRGVSG